MAEIAFTEELSEKRTRVFKWTGVTESDQFQEIDLGGLQGDATLVLSGTPGGATFNLEGSHDKTTWVQINDPANSAIALTTAGTYAAARDVFPYIRPRRSGGTGTDADLTLAVTRAG